MSRRSVTPIILIFLGFFLAPPIAGAQEKTPRAVVEGFQENLLAVMKEAAALGPRGRYERLIQPINEAFHVPLIAQVVTGSFWKKASKAQKRRLVAAFKRMSVSTLATLFDEYSGQVFTTVGEKPGPQNTRIVKTRIVDPDESFVDIAYVVKAFNNRWRIVDVVVDNGISELSTRRSEYHRLLNKEGVDGLIAALNAKADKLVGP